MDPKIARLLWRLKTPDSKGFSLVELLVVVIVIGILAALAIPSFLNAAARARQSQAKIYIGSVNRAQVQYRLENPTFAATLDELNQDLGLGIPETTQDYDYSVTTATPIQATFQASANDPVLQSYTGTVLATGGAATCQTSEASATPPTTTVAGNTVICGPNSEPMR